MRLHTENRRLLAPALAAALVAVPLLSLGQVFEYGLRLEAGAILVLLVVGWLGSDLDRFRLGSAGLPPAVIWTLGVWTMAAVWGVGLGLCFGNPLRNILSQAVAMLLLPLSTAVFARHRECSAQRLSIGMATGLLLALLVRGWTQHSPGVAGFLGARLRIGAASLADMGTILVLLGAGLTIAGRRPWLGIAVSGLGSLSVLAGLSRGQWLATGLGCSVVAIASLPTRRRRLALLTFIASAVTAVVGAVWVCRGGVERLDTGLRLADLPLEASVGGGGATITDLDAPPVAALVVEGSMRAGRGDRCLVWSLGRDAHGHRVARAWATVHGTGVADTFTVVLARPKAVSTVRLGLSALRGHCRLQSIRVAAIERPRAAWLRGLLSLPVTEKRVGAADASGVLFALGRRLRRLAVALRAPSADVTLGYRLAEQRALEEHWRRASRWRNLLGHGLGASIAFANPSWDEAGHRIIAERTSYLHNAYAALVFRMGMIGIVACGALGVLCAWMLLRMRRRPAWPAAAIAATLVAYLLWSALSPQILNFRLVPLLGALVAIAARPDNG